MPKIKKPIKPTIPCPMATKGIPSALAFTFALVSLLIIFKFSSLIGIYSNNESLSFFSVC